MSYIAYYCLYKVQVQLRWCFFFFFLVDIGAMTVTPSIFTHSFGLICSVNIFNGTDELGVPPPTFEWFFGPNGNASLPSGVTVSIIVTNNGTTYTSTIFFSPPKAGTYTCRLGGNPRLEANAAITVNTDGGIFSRATSQETSAELFYCVIALCSIILFAVVASAIVIIGLLFNLRR